jgi:hypothetical protein
LLGQSAVVVEVIKALAEDCLIDERKHAGDVGEKRCEIELAIPTLFGRAG